jgi:hypothetical protein
MERIRVKASFNVFLPLDCSEIISASPDAGAKPNFRFSVIDKYSNVVKYNIKVFSRQKKWSTEYEQPDCLTWTKRGPIRFQKPTTNGPAVGVILRIKVNQGAFDFRKVEKRFIRLQIELTDSHGQILNEARSDYFQLFPRQRKNDAYIIGDSEGKYIYYYFMCHKILSNCLRSRLAIIPLHWNSVSVEENPTDAGKWANYSGHQNVDATLQKFLGEMPDENEASSFNEYLAVDDSPDGIMLANTDLKLRLVHELVSGSNLLLTVS